MRVLPLEIIPTFKTSLMNEVIQEIFVAFLNLTKMVSKMLKYSLMKKNIL